MECFVGSWHDVSFGRRRFRDTLVTLRIIFDSFLIFDWRIGGAIVGRVTGFCPSSVLLRLVSPDGCMVPGFAVAGRRFASSSAPLFGGFAGLGWGGLIDRPNGWTEPIREAGLGNSRVLCDGFSWGREPLKES